VRKFFATLGFLALIAPAASARSIDQAINDAIDPIAQKVSSTIFYAIQINGVAVPLVLIWLLAAACVFTVYMGFINFRGFTQALRIVRGDYENPADSGEVTHFQALSAALSGTVGLGNIAGVAIAIAMGGPGATFWMILAGLVGMSTKFVECTLAVKYRRINGDGTVSGGPMYYLSRGLAKRGLAKPGKALAALFALMTIGGSFGGGNMFQINQAFQQFHDMTGFNQGWLFGTLFAVLTGLVIIGGIRSIARVTDKLVPAMCGIYVVAALVILGVHFHDIPAAFGAILHGAFNPDAVAGGFVGVLIIGFRRAAFSNEAGIGSAPIAHSAVRTNEPITEGLVALLEPFIDTVVVCTMTALVIVITGTYANGSDGIAITSSAFSSVIGWFPYVLLVAVILFAFSTMITWSYYGERAWTYLFGETRRTSLVYKSLFCLAVVLGASIQLSAVVEFSDAMIFAMAFPNVIGLYLMAPEVKRDLASYLARVRSGDIQSFRVKSS